MTVRLNRRFSRGSSLVLVSADGPAAATASAAAAVASEEVDWLTSLEMLRERTEIRDARGS